MLMVVMQGPGQILQELLPLEQLSVGPFCLFFLYACRPLSLFVVRCARATGLYG
jgi:hypothetical protein